MENRLDKMSELKLSVSRAILDLQDVRVVHSDHPLGIEAIGLCDQLEDLEGRIEEAEKALLQEQE